MPGGKTLFQDAWLREVVENKDGNGDYLKKWCSRDSSDIYAGYCKFCDCKVAVDNNGKSGLMLHASRIKHERQYVKPRTLARVH